MPDGPLDRLHRRVARFMGRRQHAGDRDDNPTSAQANGPAGPVRAHAPESHAAATTDAHPDHSPATSARRAPEPGPGNGDRGQGPEPAAESLRAFKSLALDERILRALKEDLGFEHCTPIQDKLLPHALKGEDVTGRAQTGTGKTAAFLITICQQYLTRKREGAGAKPMALIVAPTRELAIQIDSDADAISRHCGLRHAVVYGGMDYGKQREQLERGVDLLTATPGRLIDYARQKAVDLSEVELFVLDEADRMLDMGFIPDVRRIVAQLPKRENRQTLLFGATLTPDILRLAERWMRQPVIVEVEPEQVVAEGITQTLYPVVTKDKLAALLWILAHEAGDRVLVFRNRRNTSETLVRQLAQYGVHAALLSGDVPQKKRLRVLEDFKGGRIRVIVATDVAGRGIHVDDISHVVNYDLPYEPDDYVHRIGRTGRAGLAGKAISFACEEESFVIPDIEAYIGHVIQVEHPRPEMLELPARAPLKTSGSAERTRGECGSKPRRSSRKRSGGRSRGRKPPSR